MRIRCGFELTIACAQPTALVCLLSPHDERAADVEGAVRFAATPELPVSEYLDMFGNRCRRLVAPAGETTLTGDAILADRGLPEPARPEAREIPPPELPDDTLVFLLGSRYCETDRLGPAAWELFGSLPPGWSRVQAICDFVHRHLRFDYMQARSTRTAAEAFAERVGVCRDFAHLALTFCRCLNIPARYVNGYLSDIGAATDEPMDFGACVEVFLDGAWHIFDPRNNAPRIGRVVVARGRDAADVPLINSFGPHTLKSFEVWTYAV